MTVHWEQQEQSNWCWAACIRMVAGAANRNALAAQCTIVEQFLSATGCCTNGSSEDCNKTLNENRIPSLYGAFGLAADRIALDDGALQAALSSSPCVQLMLDLGPSYHYVLALGYDGASYTIADPAPHAGVFPASYDDISTAYGRGSLASAWRVHGR